MTDSTFTLPAEERYFEEYLPGSIHQFGNLTVEEKEIIDFATQYDPLIFHVDPVAAEKTPFGGIVASGWHTAALAVRLIADHYLPRFTNVGSPGVDELRWLNPVRPGDVLSVRVTIMEARPSKSKPARGIVRSLVEVINQDNEIVMSWKGMNIMLRRDVP